MKILFAAAEASPLVKVGGLADVIGSLPQALADLGHEVRTIIPAYSCIPHQNSQPRNALPLTVRLPNRVEKATIQLLPLNDKRLFYLVGGSGYFCGQQIYTDNDPERFLFFSRAVVDMLSQSDWQPDIVHFHDWHTALVPMWLRDSGLPYASVFTIHNLAYQGTVDRGFLVSNSLSRFWENRPDDTPRLPFNFMSQGIFCADTVTTVSETYAREITTPEHGAGLDTLLRYRCNDLSGILNGIDTSEFNPAADRHLVEKYDNTRREGKRTNKLALQRRLKLPENIETPLIGMVSRLDEQKGFDILEPALDRLSRQDIQLIVLGRGHQRYETMLKDTAARRPDRVAVIVDFAENLAPLIYAGSDIFLMPSKFEPCGLGQMIAMRYGSVPVVRRTGGLADTVPDVDANPDHGRGYVFNEYETDTMLAALDRALTAYQHKDAWDRLVRRIMSVDFSWRSSAMKYETVYKMALEAKNRARN